jgi:glucose uptake protein GlcU
MNKLKSLLTSILEADMIVLDALGMALGTILRRFMKKQLKKQLKYVIFFLVSSVLFSEHQATTEVYTLLATKLAACFMLATCTLYFTYAPERFFGKK